MTQLTTPILLHGPLDCSRFGKTLYIDITTPHNSLVVERGSELPRASLIVTTSARQLIDMSRAGDKLDQIMIVGTGVDPALHPDLRNIAENVRALRDKWFARTRFGLRTQLTDLEDYNIRSTFGMFNRVYLPMHWGTTKIYSGLTGGKTTDLGPYLKHLASMDNAVLEAQFADGASGNMAGTAIPGWIKKIQETSPSEVHVLSGNPPTTKKLKLKPSTKPQRTKIIEELAEKAGIAAGHFDWEEPLSK
ncbi:MAG: hypothetical protein H6830_09020 [Planctomycetes bacterium]|nr:hypothetical protein [Planctomycetota bacterium]MCB9909863.1 hypothetical protein [Planctomycetota bacterium]